MIGTHCNPHSLLKPIDSLALQLEQGMHRMSRRSRIINLGHSTTEDVEPLIDLPHEKKARIGGDLCAL
jgi:hypothetical protein